MEDTTIETRVITQANKDEWSGDDALLLGKARQGDRQAFAALMFLYRPRVWKRALRVCKNADDAEDVLQEAWIYAHRHLRDVRDPTKLGPWLGSVALHCALDFKRRRATRATPPPFWGRMMPTPSSGCDDLPAGDTNARTAERLAVLDAVQNLPAPLGDTIALFFFDGCSHDEIAQLQSVPLNTVRSRLARAKRLLRPDLELLFPELRETTDTMTTETSVSETASSTAVLHESGLTGFQLALIGKAFPQDRIVSAKKEPEAWMPFEVRVRLETPTGITHSVDIRAWADVRAYMGEENPDKTRGKDLALTPVLARLGLPVPELLAEPQLTPDHPHGNYVALTRTPRGENLLTWTLAGNTPHRIRSATALGIEAIDRLHALTDGLLADPVGATLARRTLKTDLDEIIGKGGPWLDNSLFAQAITALRPIVDKIAKETPLVYTNDLYAPNFLRVGALEEREQDAPFGWPGDARLFGRQITEYILPWGWLGDPLLGFAKFWTYDCYPFVHTGFVERYLYEKGYTARDFAPRLAVRALWTLQREVPPTRLTDGPEGNEYRNSLEGLLRHALEQM